MVAGNVFFKILNFFTRPIALSTRIHKWAIFTMTSLADICALPVRKVGILTQWCEQILDLKTFVRHDLITWFQFFQETTKLN